MTTKTKPGVLSACNLTAGQPATPDPLSENYRQLLHAVILQAWLEAHSRRHPRLAERARYWLSQPETHELGAAIGVELP
jgi:hypothetical protein